MKLNPDKPNINTKEIDSKFINETAITFSGECLSQYI